MRSDTQTLNLDIPAPELFEFLADPENLPLWAVGFARAVRREGDDWLVRTGGGEVRLRMVVDRSLGTIDFRMTPAPGVETIAYSRVLPNGAGAEYVFTQFQVEGMPDEVFDTQRRVLGEELQILGLLTHARQNCPA